MRRQKILQSESRLPAH